MNTSEPTPHSPSDSTGSFPRLFGDYELLGEVARGGMGVVYRARQARLNRVVALKMIRDSALATPKAIQRFRLEAEAAAKLSHPNIVPIHEFGEHDGHWFLSMALIDGHDLSRSLNGVPLDPRPLARLMVTLARAVHFAHQRGVLHRDLKPANIVLDADQQPHVTDFGLAKLTDDDGTFTHSQEIIGSPNYMAPEQISGVSTPLTTAADIYSLGAIMYELLCGRVPFRAPTPLEVLRKVVDEEPIRPRDLYRFASRDLETICLKCMEKDPSRRYGSAEALAEDLGRWLDHRPIRARPATTPERLLKWAQRNPKLATAVAVLHVVVFTALGAGAWMSLRIAQANDHLAAAARESRQRTEELARIAGESRRRLVQLNVQTGDRLLAEGDGLGAVPWFVEALKLDLDDPRRATLHRYRIGAVARHSPQLLQIWFHPGLVQGIAFSPDGRRVATATYNEATRLWDATTGQPSTPPLDSGASAIAFSPDGHTLATLTMGHEARLWSVDSGQPLTPPLRGPAGACYYLFAHARFSPDGSRLATSAGGPTATVWNVKTGERLHAFAHNVAVHDLQWSPDGTRLVSAGEDRIVRFWDAATGQPAGSPLPPQDGPVWSAQFSPDGTRVLTQTWRPATLRVWRADTGTPLTPAIRLGSSMLSSAFSQDGRKIVGAFAGGGAALWDATSGNLLLSAAHPVGCRFAALSPDGRFLATAGFDRAARVWDAQSGRPITPTLHHQGIVNQVTWSADSDHLMTASDDGTVRLWNLAPIRQLSRHLAPGIAHRVAVFGPRDTLIAAAGADGKARLFRTADGSAATPDLHHDGPVNSVAFDAQGSTLLTASDDRTARLWDTASGQERIPALRHPGSVKFAVFSPDQTLVATASEGGVPRLWLAATGQPSPRPLAPLPLANPPTDLSTTFLAFSHDGSILAAADPEGGVHIWEVATGSLRQTLEHAASVVDLAFSPDDQRLVSSVWDGAPTPLYAQMWNTRSWQTACPPLKFTDGVYHSSFSPDSKTVISAGEDNQAVIWDTATGRKITPPLRHDHTVRHATFSADGRRVVTASQDGTARVWDAATGEAISQSLRHGGTVYQARFSADGESVLTASLDGIRLWDLPQHQGDVDDLLLQAQVASGERLEPTAGLLPLDHEELRERWDLLQNRRRPAPTAP